MMKSEEKNEKIFRRWNWLMHHIKLIYINTFLHFLKIMTDQKIYTFWYCVVNDEVPLTSSQIAEQIEAIQKVVLLGISKLNDSAIEKKYGNPTQLFQKKMTIEKGKWTCFCLLFSLSQQLMDRVIE